MSDKKPDWQTPNHNPDHKSGEKKRADVWSSGPAKVSADSDKPFTFDEFNEARGRKTPYIEPETTKPNGKKRLLVFFGLLILLYFILNSLNPDVSIFDNPYGVKSLVFLVVIGGSFVYFSRASKSAIFKSLVGWVLIVSVAAGLYTVGKGDSYTFASNISPSRIVTDNGEMQVKRALDGHFWIMTQINGKELPMMVDTGATMVVLSKRDAKRVGIAIDELRFTGSSSTANGSVSFASTRLDNFEIGHVSFKNFTIAINGGEMKGSLLGLNALNQFKSYEMRGDVMILRP
jgi:aspartyl protease family protein